MCVCGAIGGVVHPDYNVRIQAIHHDMHHSVVDYPARVRMEVFGTCSEITESTC